MEMERTTRNKQESTRQKPKKELMMQMRKKMRMSQGWSQSTKRRKTVEFTPSANAGPSLSFVSTA